MGLFGRLLHKGKVLIGAKPPVVPAGGRAFVAMQDVYGSAWTIRVAMPGEDPTIDRPRLAGAPTFVYQVNAYRYLGWVNGGPPFIYPPGEA